MPVLDDASDLAARSFQAEKTAILTYQAALDRATPETAGTVLAALTAPEWHWRGMHPFHERIGAAAVAEVFWVPFLTAMQSLRRRQDVFFAGDNGLAAGGRWVVSLGHFLGLFDAPFLGIPPTRRIAMTRYAEFHRVVAAGRIAETALFVDLIHLMQQAVLRPLPPETGMHLVQPGPATSDGVLTADGDPGESAQTLALIERMIGDINRSDRFATPEDELRRCWHEDMLWWGPAGIGATYTIPRYIAQHQRPFRQHLSDRRFNGHICRIAEGRYGGFFGWPNLTLTPVGNYLGLPATSRPADMRVVDIYRRDGDKLAENWVFIDILHFLAMQGLDVLERMRSL